MYGRLSDMKPWFLRCLVLVTALAVIPTTAAAQTAVIDYVGYGWEDGGFPPSDPGDLFVFTAVATSVDPAIGVDLGTEEVTFYVYGLTSMGEVPLPGGLTSITYTNGTLEIYRDAAMNAWWGTNPPNATSPSTFADGTLLFQGSFTSFNITILANGDGIFEGNLDGVGGELLGSPCTGCVYTFSGVYTRDVGAQIPDGYDVQVDGQFEIDESVPQSSRGWGAVKAMYAD
jgi:hypothetical protein